MSPYADNNQDQGGGASGHNINSSTENAAAEISLVVNGNGDIGGRTNNKPIPIITTTSPAPAAASSAATVAPSNINNNNISLSSSSSSAPSLNSSSSGITTTNSVNSNNNNSSTSPPLSDIETYLNAYPSDLPELIVAACWWAESLSKMNQTIPKDNIKRFRKELIAGLRDRVRGHWYPDYPERGQGYRALICEETTDRLLMDSAKKSDIPGDFRSFFKQNTTMWIDPGNVTYRHGKHYEKTLYPLNFMSNSNNSCNINSSTSSSLNNSTNGGNGFSANSSQNSTVSANHLLHSSYNNYMNGSLNGSNGMPPQMNHTPPRPNGMGMGRVSSPSLSSAAPVFSPSSSVYHSNINNNISPPASPAKDNINTNYNNNNNNNVYFHGNSSKIKLFSQYN
ncbi:hypothetical protein CYY_004700 [Polysphondylium violaceum]|uniref:Anti-proliferative protein domain-containing protein n=1 Tax=Polysphondylium violaceum TaxID=133409 RepID=A0A8J4V062_9MYCE|nr:hypothetical protein CYY_004700 [Polysphondylium violaceum]